MGGIPALADECRDRYFPRALLSGKIKHDQLELTPGDVDLALIEFTLQQIAEDNNLLIISPFASPLEPALIIMSYMKASDPQVPGAINERDPSLLLPYNQPGYIGGIKDFDFADVVSGGEMYAYESVSTAADIEAQHRIYSAKTSHVIDPEPDIPSLGMVFVDLRNETWKQSIADLEAFGERNNIGSFVFYATDRGYAEEIAAELVDETFEVSQEAMAQSTVARPRENPTPTRIQETIFGDSIDIKIRAAETARIGRDFRELYGARQRVVRNCQQTDLVRLLNGLLLDLPVPPTRYDQKARHNGFFDSTLELIETIDDLKSFVSGTPADAFQSFKEKATEVRWQLNDENPRRRLMTDAIEAAGETEEPTTVVVRNRLFEKAVKSMLFNTAGRIPKNVEITARRDVSPQLDRHVIFASAPRQDSPFYEFPPASKITFITYPFLVDSLQSRLETQVSADDGPMLNIQLDVDEAELDEDIDTEPAEEEKSISLAGIEEDIDPTVSSSPGTANQEPHESGAPCTVTFADGTQLNTYERRRLTVYEQTGGEVDVNRVPAKTLSSSQRVVLIESAAQDLYQQIVEHKHNQERVETESKWVASWRSKLREALEGETAQWDYDEFLEEMQERGSELETAQSIREWVDGERIGPRDPDDVRITLAMINPRFTSKYDRIYEAMQYLRVLHQRIGRRVRDHIIAELDPGETAGIETEVDAQLTDVVEQAEVKRIADVSVEDNHE